jgi:hypothetical protein
MIMWAFQMYNFICYSTKSRITSKSLSISTFPVGFWTMGFVFVVSESRVGNCLVGPKEIEEHPKLNLKNNNWKYFLSLFLSDFLCSSRRSFYFDNFISEGKWLCSTLWRIIFPSTVWSLVLQPNFRRPLHSQWVFDPTVLSLL